MAIKVINQLADEVMKVFERPKLSQDRKSTAAIPELTFGSQFLQSA
jgi:hypothetical protein